ncbi:MAG: lysine--tRNA ligase [Finegoldia magna]|uniref:lysine--tRNA ligase n=1 Tax=Finegoldia magna TaxID=1260 RepID=UPI0029005D94|nr:lysine--tRNA ligase [Finegoldia magna]MDU2897507.1 lysine--tRNA ligase [Finegoldia magna]MDU5368838.1 lysine--tRNA ligase [Finegoldia magna]MDU5443741.1 lysine--tRNA ligase [Finegoldia magna]
MENLNEMLQIRRQKLQELLDANENPYVHEKFDNANNTKEIIDNFDEFDGKEVKIAGRIMSKRGHGKVNFMDLQDSVGRIQLFNKVNELGEENYAKVKNMDIGDIVGVEGTIFKTQSGEISIRTKSVVLLSKSLQILPEKWHGLKDPDLRYRQRYVDLIMNPEIKDTFIKRSKIISAIREFLDTRGFLEVDTPILNTIAGGANARPFITHHNTLDIDMYLRIANELYLKRLIVGGFDKVYEMGRMFRNEGMDHTHNPEYTAIELYQAYADYNDMMNITEQLVAFVCEKVNGSTKAQFGETEIDFTPPWRRITMVDAIKEYADINFDEIETDEQAREVAKANNVEISDNMSRGEVINECFEHFCEEKLVQPTFVLGHPVEVSPLAKRNPDDERYTHRFEAFVCTKEIANAFSELNNPIDQKERFLKQVEARENGDDEAQMMDYDFLNALEVGLPPTGGLGIGVDRLIMMLTNNESIRDIMLFPTMKPVGNNSSSNSKDGEDNTKAKKLDLSKVKVEPLFEDFVDFDKFSESDFRVVKVKSCEEVPKSKKLLKFTLNDGSGKDRIILSGIKNYYSAEDLVGKTLLAITNLPPRKMMGEESCGMLLSAICEYDGEEVLNLIMLDSNIPAGSKIY